MVGPLGISATNSWKRKANGVLCAFLMSVRICHSSHLPVDCIALQRRVAHLDARRRLWMTVSTSCSPMRCGTGCTSICLSEEESTADAQCCCRKPWSVTTSVAESTSMALLVAMMASPQAVLTCKTLWVCHQQWPMRLRGGAVYHRQHIGVWPDKHPCEWGETAIRPGVISARLEAHNPYND